MQYRAYIEDSTVDDLIELEGPDSQVVLEAGYLEEKTIEADDIEEALKIASEWAAGLRSDVVDYVTIIVEGTEPGEHRRLQVLVRSDGSEAE
jgi:hypothetical protein